MNGSGKSDGRVVPGKSPNKDRGAPRSAEGMEERRPAKGNSDTSDSDRTQERVQSLRNALDRVRQVAQSDHEVKFTSLWHHVYNVDRLQQAYFGLKRCAAPGIDGLTWEKYGEDLERNLADLSGRLKRGSYRAKPVQRMHIPKDDGRTRPIGIPVLEDKIVQKATVEVLNQIYETDFVNFSYGFRQGRSQHDALNSLYLGITTRKVNWVLDADIRGFFDAIDHEWMMKFLEHRVADPRVHRHIKKWLNAGVLEKGEWKKVQAGTPQGGNISPLLANIYLHYVLDLWVDHKRRTELSGDVVIVRYADDFVVGFEHRHEALQFLEDLKARLKEFNLELHPEKTRIMEFGRKATGRRRQRGESKPESFDFLGFTHSCSRNRLGSYYILRLPVKKRMRRTLLRIKQELRHRMHWPVREVGAWLASVMRGYFQYFAVPGALQALTSFRFQVLSRWRQVLRRRGQRDKSTWARMTHLGELFLPHPRNCHPWPNWRQVRLT